MGVGVEGGKQRASGAPGTSVAQITGREGLHEDGAEGKRISETTTGFFFFTGQNGSFFLFFRECNPSFHNSGRQEEDRFEGGRLLPVDKDFHTEFKCKLDTLTVKKSREHTLFFPHELVRLLQWISHWLLLADILSSVIGWWSLKVYFMMKRVLFHFLSSCLCVFISKIITSVVGCFRTPQSEALWRFLALYNSGWGSSRTKPALQSKPAALHSSWEPVCDLKLVVL